MLGVWLVSVWPPPLYRQGSQEGRQAGRRSFVVSVCVAHVSMNDKQIDLSSTVLEMGSLLAMSDSNG